MKDAIGLMVVLIAALVLGYFLYPGINGTNGTLRTVDSLWLPQEPIELPGEFMFRSEVFDYRDRDTLRDTLYFSSGEMFLRDSTEFSLCTPDSDYSVKGIVSYMPFSFVFSELEFSLPPRLERVETVTEEASAFSLYSFLALLIGIVVGLLI